MEDILTQARKRLIFALDVPGLEAAVPLMDSLAGEIGLVKIGLEMFVKEGPKIVKEARGRGLECFLDLKLHDIPNTVESAVRSAASLDIQMITVHTAGGEQMLQRAKEAAGDIKVMGVTLLTSMDELDMEPAGFIRDTDEVVRRRALLARACNLDGLVCSSKETAMIRQIVDTDMTLVVPGIRPAGYAADDQKRVATPCEAIRNGASYIVVGRAIRDAEDPVTAAREVVKQIANGIENPE